MNRREALIQVIEALHGEIAALKNNDTADLESAMSAKLSAIRTLRDLGNGPAGPELRELANEADRLNETCRIYVNLMSASLRRPLQILTGHRGNSYRRGPVAYGA